MNRLVLLLFPLIFFSSLRAVENNDGVFLDRKKVVGTRVSIKPPAGFVEAVQFSGFMKKDIGSTIAVMSMSVPFNEMKGGLTSSGLSAQGIMVLNEENVKVGSTDAILIHAIQGAISMQPESYKWMLCFGNVSETVFVVATFPKAIGGEVSEKLKESVLSTIWDEGSELNFFESLSFRVSEAGDLKIANKIGPMLILSRNGVHPLADQKDPIIYVSSTQLEGWKSPLDIEAFTEERLGFTMKGLGKPKVILKKEIRVGGLDGFLIDSVIRDKKIEGELFVKLCLLFRPEGYYIFQGTVDHLKRDKYNPVFNEILSSFKVTR